MRTAPSTQCVGIALIAALSVTLAAQSRYVIQEVLPVSKTQPPTALTPSAWGSAVQLAPKILAWIAEQGLQRRVDQEIERLRPEIDKKMTAGGGVLVVVGIQESKVPDTNGFLHRTVMRPYVAGSGRSAPETVQQFLKTDRMDEGPAPGFVRRDTFLWITK